MRVAAAVTASAAAPTVIVGGPYVGRTDVGFLDGGRAAHRLDDTKPVIEAGAWTRNQTGARAYWKLR